MSEDTGEGIRYQYKEVVVLGRMGEIDLNRYGKSGYQLVSVINVSASPSTPSVDCLVYTFMRPENR